MILRMKGWADHPVDGHADASRLYEARRDASGEGASTFDDGHIVDAEGREVARISYNGRVWAPGPYDPQAEPLWDNREQTE